MMSTFDPSKIALNAMSTNSVKKAGIKNSDGVAETQKFLWVADGKVNMAIPVDGWNALHWYRYYSMHFRNVFDHMYTGKHRIDMLCMGSFLFRAQRELGMNASEVKACIDWIAKFKMPILKTQGKLYFIAMMKEDLNEFYNTKVFSLKHSDEKNGTTNRDLYIDPKDLRTSIKKFIIYDEMLAVKDFDTRLLLQLGIPSMLEYLTVQESMMEDEAKKFILSKIEKIINSDMSKNFADKPSSEKFERIVKTSLEWEPYPWRDFNWRKLIEKAIDFFEIRDQKWWRQEAPIINLKPAGCLKLLKSRKRERE
jgi:hypothetical protein